MAVDISRSLQDQFAPYSICFGCGPANSKGLHLKSYIGISASVLSESGRTGNESTILVATFIPQAHHIAFEGIVNGGIISAVLDCHLNWTAAWHLMNAGELDAPPCCVTAKYEVTFKAPTPIDVPLRLEATVVESSQRKAITSGVLGPIDPSDPTGQSIKEVTATGLGTFVAVKPGHPAYHRW